MDDIIRDGDVIEIEIPVEGMPKFFRTVRCTVHKCSEEELKEEQNGTTI